MFKYLATVAESMEKHGIHGKRFFHYNTKMNKTRQHCRLLNIRTALCLYTPSYCVHDILGNLYVSSNC